MTTVTAGQEPCSQCGQVHVCKSNPAMRCCQGHLKRAGHEGQPCGNPARRGQTICRFHGANAPQNRAAAEKRIAEQATLDLARKLIPDAEHRAPIADPLAKLLELASELDAFRESLRLLSNRLDNRIRYAADGAGTEQLRAEVATYRAAAGDVTQLLIAIAKLNIDDRLARLETRRVDMALTAMQSGLTDAGVDGKTRRAVMTGVSRHLRAVSN